MELDTGSALSIINERDYNSRFAHLPLVPADLTLKTYTGQKVRPKGKFKVMVKYRKKTSGCVCDVSRRAESELPTGPENGTFLTDFWTCEQRAGGSRMKT